MADKERIRELIQQLGTEEWEAARIRLVRIGKPIVPALIGALKDKDRRVRWRVAEALGEIGDARAVEPLIGALKDDDWKVRQGAAWALGDIGDGRAVEPLIGALKDDDWKVREGAPWALGKIGDARAVEPLIGALKDDDWKVRQGAAWALRKMILENCQTIESLESYEKGLDEGLARLQKRYREDDLVKVGFQIAKLKKQIAARKNELASQRDLILEDIPKPPSKKKGRMYQSMRRATHGR